MSVLILQFFALLCYSMLRVGLDVNVRSSFFLCNTVLLVSLAGKQTLRCLALALKQMPRGQQTLSSDEEKDLTFIGLVCFLFKNYWLAYLLCV